jgi:ribose 5-phosphate isomerase A
MTLEDPIARLKRAAAEKAVEAVDHSMVLGLGTGSTAALAVDAIGRRVQRGLQITAIPTSEATAAQAERLGIPLTDFGTHDVVDLTIDGADAVDPRTLNLIKGLGGALLREKIVAAASKRMIVIVDESKLAGPFGSRCPVPVEVIKFGWQATLRRLTVLGSDAKLRLGPDGKPRVTDGGNFIIDCAFGAIEDAAGLEAQLHAIVGVIETGLFIGLAHEVIIASSNGVEVIHRP